MEVNDIKAMREALEYASRVLAKWRQDAPFSAWNEYGEAIDKCRAALSAPPRNCDRTFIDHPAMYYEFKDWCNAKGHTMEPKLAYDAFDWLLATANNEKGETNGSK